MMGWVEKGACRLYTPNNGEAAMAYLAPTIPLGYADGAARLASAAFKALKLASQFTQQQQGFSKVRPCISGNLAHIDIMPGCCLASSMAVCMSWHAEHNCHLDGSIAKVLSWAALTASCTVRTHVNSCHEHSAGT